MAPVRKRVQLLLIALFAAAAWMAGLFWFVRDTAGMRPPEGAIAREAVVVLTGGAGRLEAGFDLFKQGMGRKLFISGVYRGTEARELMKLLRAEGDKKAECCVALGDAENTAQNAAETAAWMGREGFSSLYLVTANYHMRRALVEFGNAGGGFDIAPWPVEPQRLDMRSWWQDPAMRGLIVREYTKYILALLRAGVTKGPSG